MGSSAKAQVDQGETGSLVNNIRWFTDIDHRDPTPHYPPGVDAATHRANSKLFTPLQAGDLHLLHRVVHPALTRTRAPNHIVSPLTAEYYSKIATKGGLIITEANFVSLQDWAFFPGLYTDEQAAAWKYVVDGVHKKEGIILAQLWHIGRTTSPSVNGGLPGVSSSATEEIGICMRSNEPYGVPRALDVWEIKKIVQDFKRSAQLAKNSGFDGIEILGGNGFLVDQFLQDGVNKRIDEYGGSAENRSRFAIEIIDAVAEVFGFGRIGIRLSPLSTFHSMESSNPIEQYSNIVRACALRKIAYVHIGEPHEDRSTAMPDKLAHLIAKGLTTNDVSLRPYAKILAETPSHTTRLLSGGGHTLHSGLNYVEAGFADAVCYGKLFISNPDIVDRVRNNVPFAPYDTKTFYSHSRPGYTTYPTYEQELRKDKDTKNLKIEDSSAQVQIPKTPLRRKIAIIGGGVSGLSTLNAFKKVGGFQLKLFERSNRPGGVWNTDEPQFVDFSTPVGRQDLDPVAQLPNDLSVSQPVSSINRFKSSPLYPSIITNIPGKMMEGYTDPMEEASADTSPFLRQEAIIKHVEKKAQKHSGEIVLNSSVENIVKSSGGKYDVFVRQVTEVKLEKWTKETFDGVIIATGHANVPKIPAIEGLQGWKGEAIHSVSYRTPQYFVGKKVLLVGTRESAIDIALESLPHIKRPLYISQRSPHPRYPTVFERPGIKVLTPISSIASDGCTINFEDGATLTDINVIVFCTGYHISFPFTARLGGAQTRDGYVIDGLYQHTFDIQNEGIAYVGFVGEALTWKGWELQAYIIALCWAGEICLPTAAIQLEWEAALKKAKADSGRAHSFHVLETMAERYLFFTRMIELAGEWLARGGEDDWLRGWEQEWNIILKEGLDIKAAYYERVVIPGSAVE